MTLPSARAYYNEIDPFASAWLRQLIAAGHIAPGEVDTRSIALVQPDDLRGFTQCHFFAGIGVWSYALRRAGWRDDEPIWTGSCPCQPFSAAGKKKGTDDPRHLWPEWFRLIRECRPPVVVGEQVASPDGLNWVDIVSTDLESQDYAFGAADLCAAGVGTPGIRQRLYFVADTHRERRIGEPVCVRAEATRREPVYFLEVAGRGASGVLGHPALSAVGTHNGEPRSGVDREGALGGSSLSQPVAVADPQCGAAERHGHAVGDPSAPLSGEAHQRERLRADTGNGGDVSVVADADDSRPQGRDGEELRERSGECVAGPGRSFGGRDASGLMAYAESDGRREERTDGRGVTEGDGAQGGSTRPEPGRDLDVGRSSGGVADPDQPESSDGDLQRSWRFVQFAENPLAGVWADADWIWCRDQKFRPVEPGTFPLVTGAPARVGRLRGYGNALNAEVATTFIQAYRDTRL